MTIQKKISNTLSARVALGEKISLKEPQILGDWVFWLEQRPLEAGRTTLIARPWGKSVLPGQELTPAPTNLRSRVHNYGGGVTSICKKNNEFLVTWIDDTNKGLWAQSWKENKFQKEGSTSFFIAVTTPIRLSSEHCPPLADGLIDISRKRWIGIMEKEEQDYIVSFFLGKKNQEPTTIHKPQDFAGYAALSPDGHHLVWVEWEKPSMPWDASQLWWADMTKEGELVKKTVIAGNSNKGLDEISVFQPSWSPHGKLVVAEDSSGWWNLIVSNPIKNAKPPQTWKRPWPMNAEAAMPQWVYGMRTIAWYGEDLIAACCEEGIWKILKLCSTGDVKEIQQPFDELSGLYVNGTHALAIAGNSTTESGLLQMNLDSMDWEHYPSRPALMNEKEISKAENFWFQGTQGKNTHAFYYPPIGKEGLAAPLLVRSHSGPTSMANKGLNLEIQFWTTRGWGVIDVNYGGSTGFGRAYRQRINEEWGVVDVQDCASAAKALIDMGKANPAHIAISGGSAGGFTTLSCLCFTDIFKVGACRYAVSDLSSMAKDSHRFEAQYLDTLIGEWPDTKERYLQRSPLANANKIKCPIIFFQGLQDKVVPPEQTTHIAGELKKNGIPVEVHIFPEEGHGFKNSNNRIAVLENTERFFQKHLGL